MGVQDLSIDVTKEIFRVVLQDPTTQNLMDDLEVPMERARLFDVFDADGDGTLGVKEIIQGLLRVRGETQRSDVLAGYLTVRALLRMIRDFEETVVDGIGKICIRLTRLEEMETETRETLNSRSERRGSNWSWERKRSNETLMI